MYANKNMLGSVLAGVLTSVVLAAGTAQAREAAPGYVDDAGKNIIRSGSGDCVRTGSWKPAKATIVGCDGVVLDAPVEIIKGAPSGVAVLINIPAAALFAFDKAVLTEEGKQAIEEYRKDVRPELSKAYEVIVIGHTDSTGNAEYNLGLSKRRAEAVRDYLVDTGVRTERLRILGRGKNDPIASNDTNDGRALNRRSRST
jgi:OOP family OmpA-OmpF porin